MDSIELDEIKDKWLRQCGPCDAGLPAECTHPDEDYRPVILDLVREIERLYGKPPALDLPRWSREQCWTTQRQLVVALDRDAARDKRCTAKDGSGQQCTADEVPVHQHRYRRDELPRTGPAPIGHDRDTWT